MSDARPRPVVGRRTPPTAPPTAPPATPHTALGGSRPGSAVPRRILALDTATMVAAVALGDEDGRLLGEVSWTAGYRHGEELLARIDGLLEDHATALGDLGAIVVGTGPGAFTGLRVGLATAKGLAHGLAIPIVGVPTSTALLRAALAAGIGAPAGSRMAGTSHSGCALLLPAGPSDRVLAVDEGVRLLPAGTEPELAPGTTVIAIDLAGRAPEAACERGELTRARLGQTLLRIGAERLASGNADDLARLVPEYVTLPRGIGVGREPRQQDVAWSRDPR